MVLHVVLKLRSGIKSDFEFHDVHLFLHNIYDIHMTI